MHIVNILISIISKNDKNDFQQNCFFCLFLNSQESIGTFYQVLHLGIQCPP